MDEQIFGSSWIISDPIEASGYYIMPRLEDLMIIIDPGSENKPQKTNIVPKIETGNAVLDNRKEMLCRLSDVNPVEKTDTNGEIAENALPAPTQEDKQLNKDEQSKQTSPRGMSDMARQITGINTSRPYE